ncbi:MAG TPA: hypothetical protein VJM80_02585 [bacterium]|nr:hypothetical protein [bacterium]
MVSFDLKSSLYQITNPLLIGFLLILAVATYGVQRNLEVFHARARKIEDLKYLPSGKFLKPASLGYQNLLSSLFWIKTVGYFGNHVLTDRQYPYLYQLVDVVTTLDPLFEYPYEFGGIVLALEVGHLDLSDAILRKGLSNVPEKDPRYWYLPFFLGFNYMFYRHDFKTAAHYMEIAARHPGRPEYLPLLVAKLYAKAYEPAVGLQFLEEMYHSTENEQLKERIAQRIREVIVERDLQFLERARDEYRKFRGTYPENLQALVQAGIIRSIPREPLGGSYRIDSQTGEIFSTKFKERLRVYVPREPGVQESIGKP